MKRRSKTRRRPKLPEQRTFRVWWEIDESARTPKEAVRRAIRHYDKLLYMSEDGSTFETMELATTTCKTFVVKATAIRTMIVEKEDRRQGKKSE